jgi:hypothetical protein
MTTLTIQPGVQTDASGGISVAGTNMLSMSIDGISIWALAPQVR